LKKYSHIIWDWNGTLFNDLHLCVNVINKLLNKRKMSEVSTDFYKSVFTFPVKKYYEKIGFDFKKEDFAVVGKEWMAVYEERKFEAKLFSDALTTLEYFRQIGLKQYLLSAYSLRNLLMMLEHFKIKEYFERVKGLENIYAESKLDLGLKLLTEMNLTGEKALLIGDTLHDYETATAMGIDCALVSTGHQSKKVLMRGTSRVYDSLEELRKDLFL